MCLCLLCAHGRKKQSTVNICVLCVFVKLDIKTANKSTLGELITILIVSIGYLFYFLFNITSFVFFFNFIHSFHFTDYLFPF